MLVIHAANGNYVGKIVQANRVGNVAKVNCHKSHEVAGAVTSPKGIKLYLQSQNGLFN